VARAHGVDIREQGSGNPGATNVSRVLGRGWGRLVLALDILKGYLPVLLLPAVPVPGAPAWLVDGGGRTLLAAAVVLGHVFPATAGFRGGKGVATLIGGLLALDPLLALASVAVHLLVRKASGFVSVASVAMAWAFPALQLLLPALGLAAAGRRDGAGVMAALALLITLRHAPNFARIRSGTESRHGARPQPAPERDDARRQGRAEPRPDSRAELKET
jgi:glycerol-3-phosphate acyltransferase PlsY